MQGLNGKSFSRQLDLERVESMLLKSMYHLILPGLFHDGLQFLQPPSKGMSLSPTPDALALTLFVTKNLLFLTQEASLDKCSEILSRMLPLPNSALWERFQSCKQRLDVEKDSSMDWKRKEWERQYWVKTEPYTVDPGEKLYFTSLDSILISTYRCSYEVAIVSTGANRGAVKSDRSEPPLPGPPFVEGQQLPPFRFQSSESNLGAHPSRPHSLSSLP